MNIYEFIEQGGKVKTASGHEVTICNLNEVSNTEFHIFGSISMAGTKFDCFWNKDGFPHKLPLTHGLNLNPYVEKIVYELVDKDQFRNARHIKEIQTNA
jgi:hypothetical protein